ncbi:MAG: tail fiber domain-containing protein, partial [Bacteroidota bacterium]|nr:tail fiber domain-containing protein [Bacteroidota bacterium]
GVLSWANAGSSYWSLTGNSGTTASTAAYGSTVNNNFIGTTDAKDFVFATNNLERMRITNSGYVGIGTATSNRALSVVGNSSGTNVVTIQNSSNTGYSSVDMNNNAGTLSSTFGFGNSGTGSPFTSRGYFNTYGNDFIIMNSYSTTPALTFQESSGFLGVRTLNPAQTLEVAPTTGTIRVDGLKTGSSFNSSSTNANSALLYVNNSTGDIYSLPTVNNATLVTNGTGIPSWSTSGTGWSLTGNSGTTTGTNFLGTTDGNALEFKVNNTVAGYLGLSGSSYATSLGIGASGASTAFEATALGAGAQATGANAAIAVGYNSTASSQDALAVGDASSASNNETIAIGHSASTNSNYGLAIGTAASASTNNEAIAIGHSALTNSYQGIAIGANAQAATSNQVIAIGYNAKAYSPQSIALGYNTSIPSTSSSGITIGNSSTILGTGDYQLAMGYLSEVYSSNSGNIAIGYNATIGTTSTSANSSIAIGKSATINNSADFSIALGPNASVSSTSNNNTAIGYNASIGGSLTNVTALGYNTAATNSNTMVLGNSSIVDVLFSGATYNSNRALSVGNSSSNGNGAYLTNGGTWTNASDENLKEDFTALNLPDILQKVMHLNITRWRYKKTNEYHIGPMAQDFYAAFDLGNDDKHISTIDPSGIALVAIQALQKENEALNKKVDAQQKMLEELLQEVNDLKKRIQ